MALAIVAAGETGGADRLRRSERMGLEMRGFRVSQDPLSSHGNECNWYAYKQTSHEARECECNASKKMQLVVRPYAWTRDGTTHESTEIDVTGEAGGMWFSQRAYGLKHDELRARMDDIERMLIRAWNALLPKKVKTRVNA